MMGTVSSTTNVNYAANSGATMASAAVNTRTESSEFMLMLMAQLRNQNPLDPMQDKDMMGQVAQLNSLEELKSIRTTIQTSQQAGQNAYGVNLIGKQVKALLESGQSVEGKVTGAVWESNKMFLQLGEQQIPLETVVEVKEVEP